MAGMDRRTGRLITEEDEHIVQSVGVIVTTRVGERVMRRPFGGDNPDLIDAPGNQLVIAQLTRDFALALMRWEPRVRLKRLSLDTPDPSRDGRPGETTPEAVMAGGTFVLVLDLRKTSNGQPLQARVTL